MQVKKKLVILTSPMIIRTTKGQKFQIKRQSVVTNCNIIIIIIIISRRTERLYDNFLT